jgi:uncharacterized protein YgbK (DUF1537 family)
MKNSAKLLIAFYGDDFTGSTDALEQLTNAGISTMLFIDVPTKSQLAKYPNIEAIGIAGMTRSLTPVAMEKVLVPAFEALAELHPQHVHYKVCSTFDSSSTIGSIGKAIDIGAKIFGTPTVPLLVAVPKFGRYSLFGNLFARMGIGSDGQIYRLDRHPSMSKHPTTPADESDIRIHLAKQTKKRIGLFDLLKVHQFENEPFRLDLAEDEIVLFDAVKQEELGTIGQIIDSMCKENQTLFSVGSSGIEMALGAYWNKEQGAKSNDEEAKSKEQRIRSKDSISLSVVEDNNHSKPILVVSGSCSAVTADQIYSAIEAGFKAIEVDTVKLASEISVDFTTHDNCLAETATIYAKRLLELLNAGKSVILHTSIGSSDPRLANTAEVLKARGLDKTITAKLYGTLLGLVVKNVAVQFSLSRVIVAGGDSSSYAARAMEIEAVEMLAPGAIGAPVCLAHATSSIDQVKIIFKGGQVGKHSLFVDVLNY